MTPAEAARVLAKAAAFDQRTVGRADAMAWAEALEDVAPDDALAAVARHYRDSTDRIMPAHVNRITDEIARERRRREIGDREPPPRPRPVGIDERSANGLIEQLRELLPQTNAEVLRRAEWVEHEKRQARQLRAVPNPHFRGLPPEGGHPFPTVDEETA
jgi:hypothetical protein